jgi:ribosome-binding factor A
MKSYTRSERVSGEIQRIISDILRKDISDPRLNRVTISGVKMSKDLRSARIYFTLTEGKYTREDAAEGFKSALGYIKRTLAGQLGLASGICPASGFFMMNPLITVRILTES